MKHLIITACLLIQVCYAQTKLSVTHNKTTNLIFPLAIASVDRGSQDILVQKAEGAENILRVKADVKNFEETNLSVITTDGRLYSFIVNYSERPTELNITVKSDPPEKEVGVKVQTDYREIVRKKKGNVHSLHDHSSKVELDVNGFYIKDDQLFCKMKLVNTSRINYDIDQLRFYIKDKKKSKRTASQEQEVQPLSLDGDVTMIKAKSSETIIATLPKFTIPDGKYLVVQVMEKGGGRHLAVEAKNRHIMKARQL